MRYSFLFSIERAFYERAAAHFPKYFFFHWRKAYSDDITYYSCNLQVVILPEILTSLFDDDGEFLDSRTMGLSMSHIVVFGDRIYVDVKIYSSADDYSIPNFECHFKLLDEKNQVFGRPTAATLALYAQRSNNTLLKIAEFIPGNNFLGAAYVRAVMKDLGPVPAFVFCSPGNENMMNYRLKEASIPVGDFSGFLNFICYVTASDWKFKFGALFVYQKADRGYAIDPMGTPLYETMCGAEA